MTGFLFRILPHLFLCMYLQRFKPQLSGLYIKKTKTQYCTEAEYFWETLMEILWMEDLKSYFVFHNKDISVTVCLLAVWFSFKHSALVLTISATNTLQFSGSMCVIFCQPDVWSLARLSVLIPHTKLTLHVFLLCCYSVALPPCLQPGRANHKDGESSYQCNMWQSTDIQSYKTKYCSRSRYQTTTNSNQTRHTFTPPSAASSWQSVGDHKLEKLRVCLSERGNFCIYEMKWICVHQLWH